MKPIDGQKNVKPLLKIVAWSYPLWKFLFPRTVSTLADVDIAMINATLYGYSKQVLENLDIARLASINTGGGAEPSTGPMEGYRIVGRRA
jgi:hypothetical protein